MPEFKIVEVRSDDGTEWPVDRQDLQAAIADGWIIYDKDDSERWYIDDLGINCMIVKYHMKR